MKKVIILLLLVLLPFTLMAAPVFQVGGIMTYNKAVTQLSGDEFEDFTNNFSFGADIRLNLFKSWFSLDIPATIGFGNDLFTLGLFPSANINVPLKFVDIAVGVGVQMGFAKTGDLWLINGLPVDEFSEAFTGQRLLYRAAVTANLGAFGIGGFVTVPSKGAFSDFDATPSFEETKGGIAVLIGIGENSSLF